MTTQQDQEREAFEAWVRTERPSLLKRTTVLGGDQVLIHAYEIGLDAWQAALTQPQAQQAAAVPAALLEGAFINGVSFQRNKGETEWRSIEQAAKDSARLLLSSAPAAPQAQGWLPIESAPRDGRVVLVGRHMGDFGFIRGYARFEGGDSFVSGWVSNGFDEVMGNLGLGHPTHWQPLPAPPVGITVGEGG